MPVKWIRINETWYKMYGSLSATQDQIAWVVTFNIDATAVVTPLSGWPAAHLGRRPPMIWAVIARSTLPPDQRPDGTAFFHLLRNFGSSIFMSLSITILIRTTKVSYAAMVEQISPFNGNLRLAWVAGAWSRAPPSSWHSAPRRYGKRP